MHGAHLPVTSVMEGRSEVDESVIVIRTEQLARAMLGLKCRQERGV